MSNPWLAILTNLPLSRTEREVVRRFESDLGGRSFLPVADILRAHRLVDESLELLSQGVAAHPGFAVARVVLARELLQKGLVEQAWRALDESPVPLKDNLLAQKLRFKLALLLEREDVARATCAQLEQQQMLDSDSKRLAEALKAYGPAEARQKLIREMEERGTRVELPAPRSVPPASLDYGARGMAEATSRGGAENAPRSVPPAALSQAPRSLPPEPMPGSGYTVFGESVPSAPALTSAELSDSLYGNGGASYAHTDATPGASGASNLPAIPDVDGEALGGYHVVPLGEIFRPDGGGEPVLGSAAQNNGIELDSTTLADIYSRQGHYTKALSVYRRLLRMTPGNELLRRKVAELSQLEKERQDVELTVDPALVDRLETVEIIDRQIRLLSDLLAKLT